MGDADFNEWVNKKNTKNRAAREENEQRGKRILALVEEEQKRRTENLLNDETRKQARFLASPRAGPVQSFPRFLLAFPHMFPHTFMFIPLPESSPALSHPRMVHLLMPSFLPCACSLPSLPLPRRSNMSSNASNDAGNENESKQKNDVCRLLTPSQKLWCSLALAVPALVLDLELEVVAREEHHRDGRE